MQRWKGSAAQALAAKGTSKVNPARRAGLRRLKSVRPAPVFNRAKRIRLTGLSVATDTFPAMQTVTFTLPVFECQMCGHRWIPQQHRQKPPRRCPSDGCRSMRWDAEKYPGAAPPNGGGGGHSPNGGKEVKLPVIGHCESDSRRPVVSASVNFRSPIDVAA